MADRAAMLAFVLVLGAFGPGAAFAETKATPAAAETAPNSPGNELPLAADLLANAPLAGTWEPVGDGASVGVRFVPSDYPDTVTIGCDQGTMRVFINWTLQETVESGEFRIYATGGTSVFEGMAFNDGEHFLAVDVAGGDARLAVLKPRQTVFAVQASGQALVLPWAGPVAEALAGCEG